MILAVGVIPAGKHHPATGRLLAVGHDQHGRISVMALIEGDLVDVAAVRIHHVQDEGVFVEIFIERRELWLAFVQLDDARLRLPRGGEHDAPIG